MAARKLSKVGSAGASVNVPAYPHTPAHPHTRARPHRRAGGVFSGLAAAAIAFTLGVPAAAQQIYFADVFNPTFDDGFIKRVNADGSDLQTLLPIGGGLRGLAVDAAGGRMYWCDVTNFAIRRAKLDGSDVQDLVTSGLQFPSVIKVDPASGKVYWGDQLAEGIERADLDGQNREPVVSTAFHRGIALDMVNGKIYWSRDITMFRGDVRRANLDGSGQEIVVSTTLPEFKPSALALDIAGGKIYWTDYVVDVVQRSNLNGSNIETLFSAGANKNPGGIVLDLKRGKVYWGQDDDVTLHIASIRRMNLDGSNQETVISDLGSVNDLALVEDTCYPDCNGSGTLTVADFGCFQGKYVLGDLYADCNASGTLTVADFGCFQGKYVLGCP
ncbi:MAG: PQQ-binding-like beta-propeller repeat protein [Phycisphaerales bacterium]